MYCIRLWFTSVSAHMRTYRKHYFFWQYDLAAATSRKSTNRATEYGYYEQVCCVLECSHLLQFAFSFRDRFELSSFLFDHKHSFALVLLILSVTLQLETRIINVGVDWIVALEHWDLSSYFSYSWIESVPRWLQLSRWQVVASA